VNGELRKQEGSTGTSSRLVNVRESVSADTGRHVSWPKEEGVEAAAEDRNGSIGYEEPHSCKKLQNERGSVRRRLGASRLCCKCSGSINYPYSEA
jgi:hypothetical protein